MPKYFLSKKSFFSIFIKYLLYFFLVLPFVLADIDHRSCYYGLFYVPFVLGSLYITMLFVLESYIPILMLLFVLNILILTFRVIRSGISGISLYHYPVRFGILYSDLDVTFCSEYFNFYISCHSYWDLIFF